MKNSFNKNIFNNEINDLLVSVNFIERKFKKYYFILDNIKDKKQEYIILRNLYYFDSIVERIKSNFKEIEVSTKSLRNKSLKPEMKRKIKKSIKYKSFVSTILLKHLIMLFNKYSIDRYDFEVQTFIEEESLLIKNSPDKYQDVIKEEFSAIEQNFLFCDHCLKQGDGVIIEPFIRRVARKISRGVRRAAGTVARGATAALNKIKAAYNKVKNFATNMIRKISSMFTKIFRSVTNIIKMVGRIGKVVTGYLINFIKLMWKLLLGLLNFITKWVPRFFKKFFSFWRLLFIKAAKTGFITGAFYMTLSFGFTKYWDLLLSDLGYGSSAGIPSFMVDWPTLALTTWAFWTKTRFLINTQKGILYFLLEKSRDMLRFIFTVLLGLPNDRVFSNDKMSVGKRIELFLGYIYKNIMNVLVRLAVFFLIFKAVAKYGFQKLFAAGMVNTRDLLLFPVIIVKVILNFIISKF